MANKTDRAGVLLVDNGDGTYSISITGSLTTGDIQIGAVELKNGADDTRAKIGVISGLAEADNGVAVGVPVLGATTGAAVVTDAAATIQQYLRGLIKILADVWDDTNNRLNVGAAVLGTGINVAATPSSPLSADGAIAAPAAGLRLMGWAAVENSGAASGSFSIKHGTGTGDPVLVPVTLAPGESAREWYGPDGIAAASGIYMDETAGDVTVVGYYKVVA